MFCPMSRYANAIPRIAPKVFWRSCCAIRNATRAIVDQRRPLGTCRSSHACGGGGVAPDRVASVTPTTLPKKSRSAQVDLAAARDVDRSRGALAADADLAM